MSDDLDINRIMKGLTLRVDGPYRHSVVKFAAYISGCRRGELEAVGERGMSPDDRLFWIDKQGGTREEALQRGCEVMGKLFAKRLADAMAPRKIPAQEVPGAREVKFG